MILMNYGNKCMPNFAKLKIRYRVALAVEELSDEDMAAISAAEVPAEYAHLNDELDD